MLTNLELASLLNEFTNQELVDHFGFKLEALHKLRSELLTIDAVSIKKQRERETLRTWYLETMQKGKPASHKAELKKFAVENGLPWPPSRLTLNYKFTPKRYK